MTTESGAPLFRAALPWRLSSFQTANDNAKASRGYLPMVAGDLVVILLWKDDVASVHDPIAFTAIRAPEFEEDEPSILRPFSDLGWVAAYFRDWDKSHLSAVVEWDPRGPQTTLQGLLAALPETTRCAYAERRFVYCRDPLDERILPFVHRRIGTLPERKRDALNDFLYLLGKSPCVKRKI